ncbi:hypothetical protein GS393_03772 [Pseudomonas savastanoi pv. phaseolicola]|nr:hypothetical protein [Pseudomonas savastanoi pv. phaseolicola]
MGVDSSRNHVREMLAQNALFGSRKSHLFASYDIAQRGTSMGKISARADQLLNDAM